MNLGYIELAIEGGVVIRVYYDQAFEPVGPDQPLIDGPRGWCLDITNPTGKVARLEIAGQTIQIGKGDPVTTGPSSGRSRTAAQMAELGYRTRGDVNAALSS